MKKYLTALLIITAGLLQARDNGGAAGAFLRYGLDARSEALGRSVTADTKSSYNFYFNPASLAASRETTIMLNYRKLSLDRSFAYMGFSLPLKEKAVASIGWLYAGVSDIEGRDFDGVQFDTYSFNENMFHLSFALQLRENVSAGINLKLLYTRLPEFGADSKDISTNSFLGDFGVNWKVNQVEGLHLAAALKNLGGKYSWDSKKYWSKGSAKVDKMPYSYDIGASYQSPEVPGTTFNTGCEISSNQNYTVKSGIEYTYGVENQQVSLRAGLSSYTSDNKNYINTPTYGAGYQFTIAKFTSIIDYAFVQEDISPDNPHTISWRFFF